MKRKIKAEVSLAVAAISIALFTGCAALIVGGAAGAGAVAYTRGELQSNVDAPMAQVTNAVENAANRLQLVKLNEHPGAIKSEYRYRASDDKRVQIELNRVSDATTKIGIRVGTFGNRERSQQVLDEIRKDLPVTRTAPPPQPTTNPGT